MVNESKSELKRRQVLEEDRIKNPKTDKEKKEKAELEAAEARIPERRAKKPKGFNMADPKYDYICPRCTQYAVRTSNKMLGAIVTCKGCGNDIVLNEVGRFVLVKNES